MFATLLSLLPIWLLGYLIVAGIRPRSSLLERLGLGFGIGLGGFSFFLFLLMAVGVALNLLMGILIILIGLAVAVWFYHHRGARISWRDLQPDLRLSLFDQVVVSILLAFIGYLLLTSLQIGVYWPVRWWDALTEYDFRGRLFAQTGHLDILQLDGYYLAAPLLTSLAHAWGYLVADALYPALRPQNQAAYLVNGTTAPQLIYWFYFLCLLVATYNSLRRAGLGRLTSLVFVSALASTPLLFEYSTFSMIELPFSYYLPLGVIYLYLWLRERQTGDIVISGLLLGLCSWTRAGTELFVAGVVLVMLFFSWRERRFKPLGILLILYLMFNLPWRLYLSFGTGQGSGLYETFVTWQINVVKLREILDDLRRNMRARPEVALMWSFFGLVVWANLPFTRKPSVNLAPLLLTSWCVLALFVAMYAISIRLSVDIQRYLSHFWPLALYACAVSPLGRFLMTDVSFDKKHEKMIDRFLSWLRLPPCAFYIRPRSPYLILALLLASVILFLYVRLQGGYLGLT